MLSYQQPLLLSPQQESITDVDYETIEPVVPETEWIDKWHSTILEMIEVEKVYLDPELTLTELAKKMGTNASLLSKAVNTCFKVSFNDLINRHRVQEAIRLMAEPKYKNLNLLAIAFDAGFNSKSTFNRAFKKVTGHIPKDYLSQNMS